MENMDTFSRLILPLKTRLKKIYGSYFYSLLSVETSTDGESMKKWNRGLACMRLQADHVVTAGLLPVVQR